MGMLMKDAYLEMLIKIVRIPLVQVVARTGHVANFTHLKILSMVQLR